MRSYYFLTDCLYQNNRNKNKFIEVRRYKDGHYAFKQYIEGHPTLSTTTRNYTGCSLKRAKVGTWHRVTKATLLQILEDYKRLY